MPYFSMIMVTAHNKTAQETAQIWIDRRCIEEAAETIPGFQRGEVLVQDEADNKICVLIESCCGRSRTMRSTRCSSARYSKTSATVSPRFATALQLSRR